VLHHSSGSHRIYKNATTGRRTVIPFHGKRDLNVKVLRSILKQADLAEAEFVKLL
jgi:predicted RNA binding protein YcfA (HicA-like mRNA interferase family)